MSIDTIVATNVVIRGAQPAAQPLDVPILGATLTAPQAANWTAEYGSNLIVEVASDTWPDVMDAIGIADGEAIYEWLQLAFSQPVFPRLIQLGRRATPVAQVVNFDLGDAGPATDGLYRITLNGVQFDETASSNTKADVVAALIAKIDADPEYGAVVGGDAEQLDVTAAEAGAGFNFAAQAPTGEAWIVSATTPNIGLATDLTAWDNEARIRSLDLFYVASIPEPVSLGLARSMAETAGSFVRDIQVHLRTDSATDPDALNGTGTAATLAAFGYDRIGLPFVPTATDYDWAAIEAQRLPTTPGSTTWGNVRLTGVDGEAYTSAQDLALIGAPYWFFDRITSLGTGIAISRNVKVLNGTNVDVIRGADFLKASIQADVFGLLIREDKIPFTGAGYGQIGATIDATLSRFVNSGFIPATLANDAPGSGLVAGGPGYRVIIPPVPPPGDPNRVAGLAVGFAFEAVIAGSVERVEINGLLIQ